MARRRKGYWTCRRVSNGTKCLWENSNRYKNCNRCHKPKPPKRKPKHMVALKMSYEDYILLNGGEFCGICGRKPNNRRKLDRDHDHKTHLGRGLLCNRCNRALPSWMTVAWLAAAEKYLKRGQHVAIEETSEGPA